METKPVSLYLPDIIAVRGKVEGGGVQQVLLKNK